MMENAYDTVSDLFSIGTKPLETFKKETEPEETKPEDDEEEETLTTDHQLNKKNNKKIVTEELDEIEIMMGQAKKIKADRGDVEPPKKKPVKSPRDASESASKETNPEAEKEKIEANKKKTDLAKENSKKIEA